MTAIDGRPRGKQEPVSFQDLTRESAWPPTRNGMPDLSYDDYPDTLLAAYIAAPGSLEGDFHSITVNLARLADKAVREYRAAREHLDAFFETPGVESLEGHTLLLRATDFLENCIDAVRRAESFFETPAFVAAIGDAERKMLGSIHLGLRDLRNSIHHANERIEEGRIPEGEPLFPAMTTNAVFFAGEYVFYGEIAGLVTEIWLMASAGVKAATET
jgi:hypothetical protein